MITHGGLAAFGQAFATQRAALEQRQAQQRDALLSYQNARGRLHSAQTSAVDAELRRINKTSDPVQFISYADIQQRPDNIRTEELPEEKEQKKTLDEVVFKPGLGVFSRFFK